MDAQALYHKIRTEEKREDKPFDYVEFNKRDSHIVMNIVYQTTHISAVMTIIRIDMTLIPKF